MPASAVVVTIISAQKPQGVNAIAISVYYYISFNILNARHLPINPRENFYLQN